MSNLHRTPTRTAATLRIPHNQPHSRRTSHSSDRSPPSRNKRHPCSPSRARSKRYSLSGFPFIKLNDAWWKIWRVRWACVLNWLLKRYVHRWRSCLYTMATKVKFLDLGPSGISWLRKTLFEFGGSDCVGRVLFFPRRSGYVRRSGFDGWMGWMGWMAGVYGSKTWVIYSCVVQQWRTLQINSSFLWPPNKQAKSSQASMNSFFIR